jgi:hypothetical protein
MLPGPPSLQSIAFRATLACLCSLPAAPPEWLEGFGARLGLCLPEETVLQLLQGATHKKDPGSTWLARSDALRRAQQLWGVP